MTNSLRQKTNKWLVCLLGKAGFLCVSGKGTKVCGMDEETEKGCTFVYLWFKGQFSLFF